MTAIEAISVGMAVVSGLCLTLSAFFVIEVMVGLRATRTPYEPRSSTTPVRAAVLIPAHNEAAGIVATVTRLAEQLGPSDRVLVVADNCTDATATLARSAGATVIERTDTVRRGKGFALDFGVRALEADAVAPDVVVIFDADCWFDPACGGDALRRLAGLCVTRGSPVQAAYVMDAPADAGVNDRVSSFAVTVKNVLRPRGLRRLGGACLLTGTGMALPWAIARRARLATGDTVEDMKLGIDLAIDGAPPMMTDTVTVRAWAGTGGARQTQRTRWEQGHLRSIIAHVPRLLVAALVRMRPSLLLLALELAVPPLSLLVMVAGLVFATALALFLVTGGTGGTIALSLASASLACVSLGVWASWLVAGRSTLSVPHLLALPGYALSKVGIYRRFNPMRRAAWVRTARQGEGVAPITPGSSTEGGPSGA